MSASQCGRQCRGSDIIIYVDNKWPVFLQNPTGKNKAIVNPDEWLEWTQQHTQIVADETRPLLLM